MEATVLGPALWVREGDLLLAELDADVSEKATGDVGAWILLGHAGDLDAAWTSSIAVAIWEVIQQVEDNVFLVLCHSWNT